MSIQLTLSKTSKPHDLEPRFPDGVCVWMFRALLWRGLDTSFWPPPERGVLVSKGSLVTPEAVRFGIGSCFESRRDPIKDTGESGPA